MSINWHFHMIFTSLLCNQKEQKHDTPKIEIRYYYTTFFIRHASLFRGLCLPIYICMLVCCQFLEYKSRQLQPKRSSVDWTERKGGWWWGGGAKKINLQEMKTRLSKSFRKQTSQKMTHTNSYIHTHLSCLSDACGCLQLLLGIFTPFIN